MSDLDTVALGADPTPVPEGAWPSGPQLLHFLLTCTPEERQQWVERAIADAQAASDCFLMDHERRLEDVTRHRDSLAAALDGSERARLLCEQKLAALQKERT